MAEANKILKESIGSSSGKSGFNTPAVVLVTLAVLILIYALSLFFKGGFLTVHNLEYQAKVMNVERGTAIEDAAGQQAILDEGYRWIDQANGKVGVPIEDAKDLVVKKGR